MAGERVAVREGPAVEAFAENPFGVLEDVRRDGRGRTGRGHGALGRFHAYLPPSFFAGAPEDAAARRSASFFARAPTRGS